MINIIIAALALLAALPLAAEDELTLKDGRVLVGKYDDVSETLSTSSANGKARMELSVKRDDIASRRSVDVEKVVHELVSQKVAARKSSGYDESIGEIRRLFQRSDAIESEHRKAMKDIEASVRRELEKMRAKTEKEFDASPIEIDTPKKATSKSLTKAMEIEALNKWMAGRRAAINRSAFDREQLRRYGDSGDRTDYWRLYCDARGLPRAIGDLMWLNSFGDRSMDEIRQRILPGDKME